MSRKPRTVYDLPIDVTCPMPTCGHRNRVEPAKLSSGAAIICKKCNFRFQVDPDDALRLRSNTVRDITAAHERAFGKSDD